MGKNNFIIILLILISSCSKNLSNINNDPKASTTAPSASVFTTGEKDLVDLYTTDSWLSAPFRVLAQSWTQNSYNNEAHYEFSANNAPGGWWNNIYTNALHNLDQAKGLFVTDVKDTNILKNDRIIADILEIYSFNLLVNTYGNVPYSESLSRSNAFPKYDDAKTITLDLLSRLDTCISGLRTGYSSLGTADQIYKGDVSKWKKFAATLKLKIALLIADKYPDLAASKVAEADSAGVFTSNDDNAVLEYDSSSVSTSNPIWQDLIYNANLHYYGPSAFVVNTMKSLNDPRLPFYFTKDPNGTYSGGIAGEGNSSVNLSSFSSKWLSASYPGDILDYTETEFLLAEAVERDFDVSGTAAEHYNNAITASIIFWGGTQDEANTYIAQNAVNYSSAEGTWRQKIGYQKWIAFINRNWDAWTEIRRLGYPDIDEVSPPVGATGNLPLRFYYPPSEESSNASNWAAAVAALPGGEDVVSAKLFWMK